MAIIGRWKAEWESKKKYFETESGKKKPSEKYLGFFRKGSGVSTAFGAMDKAYAKLSAAQGENRKKELKAFEAAIEAAKKTGNDYTKTLEASIASEATKKQLLPLLKILIKDIDNCIVSAEAQLTINKEITRDDGSIDAMAVTKEKPLKALAFTAVKKALMWIALQERKPNAAEFNKGVQTATRDITQNLGNLIKLYPKGSKEYKELSRPLVPLLVWANKGKKLPADTSFDKVIVELSHLKNLIKTVAPLVK